MAKSRLLIVDDEPRCRDLLQRVAKDCGFEVAATGDAGEFRRLCDSFAPDVVAIDLLLTDCNGLDLAEWLAKRGQAPRVLIISGRGAPYLDAAETVMLLRGLPWFKVLAKPIQLSDLRDSLVAARDSLPAQDNRAIEPCGQPFDLSMKGEDSPIMACARRLSDLHNRFGEGLTPDFQEAVSRMEKEIISRRAGNLAETAVQLMLTVVYLERMREDVVIDVVETTQELQSLLSSILEQVAQEAGINLGEFGGDWYISPETLRAFSALRGLKRLHA